MSKEHQRIRVEAYDDLTHDTVTLATATSFNVYLYDADPAIEDTTGPFLESWSKPTLEDAMIFAHEKSIEYDLLIDFWTNE